MEYNELQCLITNLWKFLSIVKEKLFYLFCFASFSNDISTRFSGHS